MEQLYRVDFKNVPGSRIQLEPYRNVTRARADEICKTHHTSTEPTVRPDGFLTTIREFVGPENKGVLGEWYDSWLDEPCVASVYGTGDGGGGVWCSGRAIACFTFQADRPSHLRTHSRCAYLVLNDKPAYGPIGLRVNFSA